MDFCDFFLCVPASPPVVPVNVVCEVVFSYSGCEFVEPQTFFLSPENREATVALECETEMHTEGPPVTAVPEAVRNRPTPQSTPFKAAPESMRSRAAPPTRRHAFETNGDLDCSTSGST